MPNENEWRKTTFLHWPQVHGLAVETTNGPFWKSYKEN
jgi:hypothetical protein